MVPQLHSCCQKRLVKVTMISTEVWTGTVPSIFQRFAAKRNTRRKAGVSIGMLLLWLLI